VEVLGKGERAEVLGRGARRGAQRVKRARQETLVPRALAVLRPFVNRLRSICMWRTRGTSHCRTRNPTYKSPAHGISSWPKAVRGRGSRWARASRPSILETAIAFWMLSKHPTRASTGIRISSETRGEAEALAKRVIRCPRIFTC